jgi:hypothetical protein
MAANPVPDRPIVPHAPGREGGWQRNDYGGWDNGLDGEGAASITEHELKGPNPVSEQALKALQEIARDHIHATNEAA